MTSSIIAYECDCVRQEAVNIAAGSDGCGDASTPASLAAWCCLLGQTAGT